MGEGLLWESRDDVDVSIYVIFGGDDMHQVAGCVGSLIVFEANVTFKQCKPNASCRKVRHHTHGIFSSASPSMINVHITFIMLTSQSLQYPLRALEVINKADLDRLASLSDGDIAAEATLLAAIDVDDLEAPDLGSDPASGRAGNSVQLIALHEPWTLGSTAREVDVGKGDNVLSRLEEVLRVDGAEKPVGVRVDQTIDETGLRRTLETTTDDLVKVNNKRLGSGGRSGWPGSVGLGTCC